MQERGRNRTEGKGGVESELRLRKEGNDVEGTQRRKKNGIISFKYLEIKKEKQKEVEMKVAPFKGGVCVV